MKRIIGVVVFSALGYGALSYQSRTFNSRMNEDAAASGARLRDAGWQAKQVEAFQAALLDAKRDTESYVEGTTLSLILLGGLLIAVLAREPRS